VSRLGSEIARRGLRLFAVIDQSAEAAAHGLELRDTKLVVFGNPLTGTPAMQANPQELASRYELSAGLARGLTGVETVTDAVLNRT
jgi:uncharacterized protein (DUF302 family)